MKYYKKLTGERIYLSPINPDDFEIYTKWLNDPAVVDGLGMSRRTITALKEKELLEAMAKEDNQFAIVRLEDDALLGNCGLHDINQIHSNATCGLFIGEESNRGKGYGGEALRLLQEYAFETLRVNNLMLKVFSFNPNAVKCYLKCGFKEIGRRRTSSFLYGEYHDDIFMDILAEEYFAWKKNK